MRALGDVLRQEDEMSKKERKKKPERTPDPEIHPARRPPGPDTGPSRPEEVRKPADQKKYSSQL